MIMTKIYVNIKQLTVVDSSLSTKNCYFVDLFVLRFYGPHI